MNSWDENRDTPHTPRRQDFFPSRHGIPSSYVPPKLEASAPDSLHRITPTWPASTVEYSPDLYVGSSVRHSNAAQRIAFERPTNVVTRLDSWWMGFSAPYGYASRMRLDAKESDRLRRGKLLARALSALLIVCTLAALITFVSFATSPTLTWLIQLAAVFIFVVILIGLSRLNYYGHVEFAALLTALLLMAIILAGDLSTDLAVAHSYNWTDVPSWDLLIAPLVLVSLTMRKGQAWLIFGLYLAIMIVVVVGVPQSPEVLSADLASGGVSLAGSSAQQHLSLNIDLLWRSVTLALFACIICTVDNAGTMEAMRRLDASEEVAYLRKAQLDNKEEQQRWILRTAQSLDKALKEGVPFKPDPLPASWRGDANMLSLREQLVLVGHRLKSGQQAEYALGRIEQHARQLQNRLQEHRDTGGRANQDTQRRIPFNEYLLIVDFEEPLGSVQAEITMSHFRHYLTMLAQEEEQTSREIQATIGEYVNGHIDVRVNPTRKSKRLGQTVSAINFLLDHVQLPPSISSQGLARTTRFDSNLADFNSSTLPERHREQ